MDAKRITARLPPICSKQSQDNARWSQLPATVQMGRHERKIETADPISRSQYCTAASEKFLDKDALLFRVRVGRRWYSSRYPSDLLKQHRSSQRLPSPKLTVRAPDTATSKGRRNQLVAHMFEWHLWRNGITQRRDGKNFLEAVSQGGNEGGDRVKVSSVFRSESEI